MTSELVLCLALSFIPACFSYLLDYCLGRPGSDEPSIKDIFSSYTLDLARKRLIKEGKLAELKQAFYPLMNSDDQKTRRDGKNQMNQAFILEGRKYFGWEKAFGMCMYCTNVWIALLAAGVIFCNIDFTEINPILVFLLIPILSHSILRHFKS